MEFLNVYTSLGFTRFVGYLLNSPLLGHPVLDSARERFSLLNDAPHHSPGLPFKLGSTKNICKSKELFRKKTTMRFVFTPIF